MSSKYLGQPFDIHGGGLDLRFPHHENEIAQSEAAYGKKFVNYWMHAGMLNIDGEKMSNSLGNFIEIPDVLKNHDPMAVRYWRATVHYRSVIDYTDKHIQAAATALGRLRNAIARFELDSKGKKGSINVDAKGKFSKALEDDFNLPEAVAVLWEVVKSKQIKAADKQATLYDFDTVLGLRLDESSKNGEKITKGMKKKIEQLMKERDEARKKKDWDRSDEIRKELLDMKVKVEDTPNGSKWMVVS